MRKNKKYQALYTNRKLSCGYPNLEHLGSLYKKEQNLKNLNHQKSEINENRTNIIIDCLFELVDFESLSKCALDIGCGPTPLFVRELIEKGFDAKGVEPVDEMCQFAKEFLSDDSLIIKGYAEKVPVPDNSQSFVTLNSVLEHVISPNLALNEIYRVLEPGGVAYISTTNKYMFRNMEYTKRFYQWYPAILKESYVFMHLHYRPELARYTSIPAVHWFSYSELCKLGRDAGFFSFYSLIDLISEDYLKNNLNTGSLKRFLFKHCKYNSLMKSLILTFTGIGGAIFMIKPKSL
ncbi:MAG: class I SAM-dependent methyltransferase [Methanobacterium sp.]